MYQMATRDLDAVSSPLGDNTADLRSEYCAFVGIRDLVPQIDLSEGDYKS